MIADEHDRTEGSRRRPAYAVEATIIAIIGMLVTAGIAAIASRLPFPWF